MIWLLQATNQNLILGFVPESVGLLIFGVVLIALTVALRWILKRGESHSDVKAEKAVKS